MVSDASHREYVFVFSADDYDSESAIYDLTDKVAEAGFFLEKLHGTVDLAQFRWLTSAFLSAAASCLDHLGWHAYNASVAEDGESIRPDDGHIATLSKYVKLIPHAKQGNISQVHISPENPLLKRLWFLRRESVHRAHVSIISKHPHDPTDQTGTFTSNEFYAIAHLRDVSTNTPCFVLPFCRSVLDLLETIHEELRFPNT